MNKPQKHRFNKTLSFILSFLSEKDQTMTDEHQMDDDVQMATSILDDFMDFGSFDEACLASEL